MSVNTKNRKYLPEALKINSWQSIEKYFNDLANRDIKSIVDLENWLKDRSELDSVLEEDFAWRYIKMNCSTENEQLAADFNLFVNEIEPKISVSSNQLDQKLMDCSFTKDLDQYTYYVALRSIKNRIDIFRNENVPLIAELQTEQQEFQRISGAMMINYDEKELTLQQAGKYLKETDRNVRETVYHLVNERRIKDVDRLNDLFSSVIRKRDRISKNAGFENYRDYRLAELGRFDYTTQDCYQFHDVIRQNICPIVDVIDENRKNCLKLDKLKPYDLEVDIYSKPPLQPFTDGNDLLEKAISCFQKIRPKYGRYLTIMKENGYLDLDSRKGKAPGGFNYPLYESDIPFIFMNAAGNFRDLTTMVHEGGHAIHSFESKDLPLVNFKELTPEIAELASMSMELISMEHWDVFFTDKDELIRAKQMQLESIIKILPWIATIDQFQHWVYLHPDHSIEDRIENWTKIARTYSSKIVDWQGCEWFFVNSWQKQIHLFETPFYYIEYGIAQLGAISIWKNYKQNPEQTLDNFEKALKLGYSVTIPQVYQTAGIKFDFSEKYIGDLMEFVRNELDNLK
jgi:oligoendopeptidase F